MKDERIRIEGESIGMITIGEEIVIKDLAEKLGINVSDIIKKFFMQGKMLTANAILSFEEAEEVALDYEVIVEKEEIEEISYGEKYHLEIEDREQDLIARAKTSDCRSYFPCERSRRTYYSCNKQNR